MVATQRLPITVRLESFEGPLDLLLYLIQSNELDISRVSIAKITDQYLASIRLMREFNFEVAGDFLLMAATLLYWKSKALLPKKEEESSEEEEGPELSQESLILQILEHKRFLAAGDDLNQLPQEEIDFFIRPYRKPQVERVWREMSLSDLAMSYQEAIKRGRAKTSVLRKETVSVSERIRDFGDRLKVGVPTELKSLLQHSPQVGEVVVTFLASLELSKIRKMRVHQQETYDPIYLELLEDIRQISLDLASDFDVEALEKEAQSADAQSTTKTPTTQDPKSNVAENAQAISQPSPAPQGTT